MPWVLIQKSFINILELWFCCFAYEILRLFRQIRFQVDLVKPLITTCKYYFQVMKQRLCWLLPHHGECWHDLCQLVPSISGLPLPLAAALAAHSSTSAQWSIIRRSPGRINAHLEHLLVNNISQSINLEQGALVSWETSGSQTPHCNEKKNTLAATGCRLNCCPNDVHQMKLNQSNHWKLLDWCNSQINHWNEPRIVLLRVNNGLIRHSERLMYENGGSKSSAVRHWKVY